MNGKVNPAACVQMWAHASTHSPSGKVNADAAGTSDGRRPRAIRKEGSARAKYRCSVGDPPDIFSPNRVTTKCMHDEAMGEDFSFFLRSTRRTGLDVCTAAPGAPCDSESAFALKGEMTRNHLTTKKGGRSVNEAIPRGELRGPRRGAPDIRPLFSLDGGRTLQDVHGPA